MDGEKFARKAMKRYSKFGRRMLRAYEDRTDAYRDRLTKTKRGTPV